MIEHRTPASSRPARRPYRAGLITLALVAASCGGGGGGDEPAADDAAATTSDIVDAPLDTTDDTVAATADATTDDADAVPFDGSALGLDPVSLGSPGDGGLTPTVDACAALPAARFNEIVTAFDEEFWFGDTFDFTATSDGSRCRYEYLTHVLRLAVGTPDQVTPTGDSPAVDLPAASGEVTATGWSADARVSILAEDSFGLGTPFAAHATAGDLAVVVSNTGGTGLDLDGELFGRLAAAAADGVAGAPPVADGVESDGVAPAFTAPPCSLWSDAELDGFLTDAGIDESSENFGGDSCFWFGPGFVEITVDVLPLGDTMLETGGPLGTDGPVFSGPPAFDSAWVEAGDTALFITVRDLDASRSGYPAAVALAENLAARLG